MVRSFDDDRHKDGQILLYTQNKLINNNIIIHK